MLFAATAGLLVLAGWLVWEGRPERPEREVPEQVAAPTPWPVYRAPYEIVLSATPARMPIPDHCLSFVPSDGTTTALALADPHAWWNPRRHASPRVRAWSRALGMGPSDLAPWVAPIDPWLAHALVDEERAWVGLDGHAYADAADRLDSLLDADGQIADSSGDPELARVTDLIALDLEAQGLESPLAPTNDVPTALDLILEGSDAEAQVGVARLCSADLLLDPATHRALRERVARAADATMALRLVEVGLRSAWNAGQRGEVIAWAARVEPTLDACDGWGPYAELSEVVLPTFGDLGSTFGPDGAREVADTLAARWPWAHASVDCDLAPCVLRFGMATEDQSRNAWFESRNALPDVGWAGVSTRAIYDDRGPSLVIYGATAEASGLEPETFVRWTEWRSWRSHVWPWECLVEGERAKLLSVVGQLGWRAIRSWEEDLDRAAQECHAVLPLRASAHLDARWDGDRWALDSELPFVTCVEDATVLGPPEPTALRLDFRVDDGTDLHGR